MSLGVRKKHITPTRIHSLEGTLRNGEENCFSQTTFIPWYIIARLVYSKNWPVNKANLFFKMPMPFKKFCESVINILKKNYIHARFGQHKTSHPQKGMRQLSTSTTRHNLKSHIIFNDTKILTSQLSLKKRQIAKWVH